MYSRNKLCSWNSPGCGDFHIALGGDKEACGREQGAVFVLNSHWAFFFSFGDVTVFVSDVEESVYLPWFHMIEVPSLALPCSLGFAGLA